MADWPARGTKPWDVQLKAYIDEVAGGGGTVTVEDITDATVLGKALLKAADALVGRNLLGLATVASTGSYNDLTDKPTSLPPSGGAGGVLSGAYPNPGFAVDMAEQSELDAVNAASAKKAANLSDLLDAAAARSNLGLAPGTATRDLGLLLSDLGLRAAGTAFPLSTSGAVEVNGPYRQFPTTRSASYTQTPGSSATMNFCDATSGAIAVSVATLAQAGHIMTFVKTDASANAVVITPAAGTIDGLASYTLSAQYQWVRIITTGSGSVLYTIGSGGVQQGATQEIGNVLANLGLRAVGGSYPITTAGLVTLNGAIRTGPIVRTANTTLTGGSNLWGNYGDASAGAFTITLTATTSSGYRFFIMKTDSSANPVTIAATIDGQTNYVLTQQYQYVEVMSTTVSGEWHIIDAGPKPVIAASQWNKFVSGNYYGVPGSYVPALLSWSAGTQLFTPLFVPHACTIDRIACEVQTGVGGSTLRFGIYNNVPATDKPGTLLLDGGTASSASSGVIAEVTVSQVLQAGLYWMAIAPQGGAPTLRVIGTSQQPPVTASTYLIGSGGSGMNNYQQTGITGAFADVSGALSTGSNAPLVKVRVA